MAAGERREYRGAAAATTLNGAIGAGDTNLNLTSATNWPDGSVGPFFIVVDPGLAAEEKIKCISRTGNSITVVTSPSSGRGADGTAATTHVSGAAVQHVWTADDADKVNAHVNDQNDNHPSLLNVSRHDTTTRHPLGTVVPAGSPGASAVGDVAAQGVSGSAARADHTHGREAFGSTSTITLVNGTPSAGSASTVARSDHSHYISTTNPQSVGSAIGGGTSQGAPRVDHVHDAPQHTRVLGRTATAASGGTPPAAGTGPWLVQLGNSTGTAPTFTVGFPSAFPGGCMCVVPVAPPATFIDVESVTASNFSVKVTAADGGGHIVNATGSVSFGWVAFGW